MNKIKIIISFLLSFFFIFSFIPLSSQAQAYNFVNSQYLTINPYYLLNYTNTISQSLSFPYLNVVIELEYQGSIVQFYSVLKDTSSFLPNFGYNTQHTSYLPGYRFYLSSSSPIYYAVYSAGSWSVPFSVADESTFVRDVSFLQVSFNPNHSTNVVTNGYYQIDFKIPQSIYDNVSMKCNFYYDYTSANYSSKHSYTYREYCPDILTAAVILGLQNSGGSGSGSVDTSNIINAIIQARESIIDSIEDGDDYTQAMLTVLAEILYGDLSGNDNEPTVQDILDSGAINILDYYFKDYFNQLYNRYKNENNQIVNAIWQALNTGNAVNASDNVAAINALKAAIRDEIANSGQLSYIEYISYIVDYLDVFYMSLYNQNVEILQKVDRLLTISSSNTATITNRIQQSENNIIDGINDAGENTGSPDLSHTGLDSALSQGSGWAAQILHASSIIDQATQDVKNFLVSGSSVLNSILTAFPIFGVILSFVFVFFLVRKVIGR